MRFAFFVTTGPTGPVVVRPIYVRPIYASSSSMNVLTMSQMSASNIVIRISSRRSTSRNTARHSAAFPRRLS